VHDGIVVTNPLRTMVEARFARLCRRHRLPLAVSSTGWSPTAAFSVGSTSPIPI
jgi:hypothetical protein